MSPFDSPPSSPPVSFEAPEPPDTPAPRRGRMVVAVFATAGVIGAAAFGVSELASADDEATLAASATTTVPDDTDDTDDTDGTTAEPDDGAGDADQQPSVDTESGDGPEGGIPSIDGELRIETGDGDPIIIDLGELAGGDLQQFQECVGLPVFGQGAGDLPSIEEIDPLLDDMFGDFGSLFDELPEGGELDELFRQFEEQFGGDLDELFGEFDAGTVFPMPGIADGAVTVTGPDGVTIIDLGDGDATVTITRDGDTGEITVTTDGSASEQQLDELTDVFPLPHLGDPGDGDGDFEFDFALPDLSGGIFESMIDPELVESCLAELEAD